MIALHVVEEYHLTGVVREFILVTLNSEMIKTIVRCKQSDISYIFMIYKYMIG